MKTKKALFFDIDGTLYQEGKGVPESTKKALRRLRENGHCSFVCSGRGKAMVSDEILNLPFDGVLSTCGMYGEYQKETMFCYEMEPELILWTRQLLAQYDTNYIMEGNEFIYYNEENLKKHGPDWYIKAITKKCPERFLPLCAPEKMHASKCGVHIFGERETVEEGFARLSEKFQVMRHTEHIAEIVPKGYSKGTGIAHICQLLDISLEETVSFGDSCNDADMLMTTRLGIVMGDGTQEAKKYADYITTPLYEDGIWNALRHFELI